MCDWVAEKGSNIHTPPQHLCRITTLKAYIKPWSCTYAFGWVRCFLFIWAVGKNNLTPGTLKESQRNILTSSSYFNSAPLERRHYSSETRRQRFKVPDVSVISDTAEASLSPTHHQMQLFSRPHAHCFCSLNASLNTGALSIASSAKQGGREMGAWYVDHILR